MSDQSQPWGAGLDPALRRRVEERVPFPVRALHDRDDLGHQLHLVDDQGDRRLYVFSTGGVLWATVRDDQVVAVRVLEGAEALRVYRRHAWRLPGELRDRIRESLAPGRDAGEALREVFGDRLAALDGLGEERRGTHEVHVFLVRHASPRRRAVLEIEVDPRGRLAHTRVLEGETARQRLDDFSR